MDHDTSSTPSAWLTQNADLLPHQGRALDVACGRGRHAVWLGARGLETTAIDRSHEAVAFVNDEARRRALPVRAEARDLETGDASLGIARYDVIVVVHYLHRPLFPALIRALRPGGLLIYETFTRAQAARGKPTNPDFLLESGELRTRVAPLVVLREREGDYEGRSVASVVAMAPVTAPAVTRK
jgi:SAM-dependent methyltransferase